MSTTAPKWLGGSRGALILSVGPLEDYLSRVCACIESSGDLSQPLVQEASAMKQRLDTSFSEWAEGSQELYTLVTRVLKKIQNFGGPQGAAELTLHLAELAGFLREAKKPKASPFELTVKTLTVSLMQEFSAELKNREPFKSICLAYCCLFAEIDSRIPSGAAVYGSQAVTFMQEYLKTPQLVLRQLKSVQQKRPLIADGKALGSESGECGESLASGSYRRCEAPG